jgi:hypothetical protein
MGRESGAIGGGVRVGRSSRRKVGTGAIGEGRGREQ